MELIKQILAVSLREISTTMMTNMISIFITTILFFSCGTTENKSIDKRQQEKNSVNSDSTLQTGWYYIVDKDNGFRRKLDRDSSFYFIDRAPIVTAKNIKTLEIYESKYGDIGLSMTLDDNGLIAWSEATNKATGKRLAFILDNKLLHTPKVNSRITNGMTALNRGIYSRQELEEIKKIIESEKD